MLCKVPELAGRFGVVISGENSGTSMAVMEDHIKSQALKPPWLLFVDGDDC